MKVVPADVTYYSSAADMLARYRRIHSTFWNPPVMPETKAAPPVPPETIRPPRRRRPKLPEPPPALDNPVELPAKFAATLPHPLSLFDRIVAAVCNEFHISRCELFSRRRFTSVVTPRFVVFALARRLTPMSLPQIGRRLGGFDHTTVLNGVHRLAPALDAMKDGMPEDATPAEWVRVMREHMSDGHENPGRT